MFLSFTCVDNNIKLLSKPDTESQNVNLCVVDFYFLSIMIKPATATQPINDSEEKVF